MPKGWSLMETARKMKVKFMDNVPTHLVLSRGKKSFSKHMILLVPTHFMHWI
jgi:hypothetical protein